MESCTRWLVAAISQGSSSTVRGVATCPAVSSAWTTTAHVGKVQTKCAVLSLRWQHWEPKIDAVLEHARCNLRRFEEALKAMGDMSGPEVEFLQDAPQERPLASQMSECRRFIERSERR